MEDDFESGNFDNWDEPTTGWDLTTSQYKSVSHAVHTSSSDLFSNNLDTSKADAVRISFWYRDDNIGNDDDVRIQLYDGTSYNDVILTYPKVTLTFELGNTTPEDTWHFCKMELYNEGSQAQYFHSNFRIKFEASGIDSEKNLWIDDVLIETSVDITDTDAHSGSYSSKLDSDGEYCQYKGAGQWVAGKTYKVSVWAKATSMSGGSVDLIFDNAVKGTIDSDTDSWELFSFDHVASSDRDISETIMAKYNNSGGTVLLDDWAVTEFTDANTVFIYQGLSAGDPWLHNPERGFRYENIYYNGTNPYTNWSNENPSDMSLVLAYEHIADFYDQNLSQARLDEIAAMLNNLRNNNMKCLLRFAYRFGEVPLVSEPTLQQLVAHINQLEPIIDEYKDVIYVWQAGFLGNWGEWHHISSQLDNWTAKAGLVDAILNITTSLNIKTMLRVPSYKYGVLAEMGEDTEANASNAYTDIPCVMIGHHDDGFLASYSDGGTWNESPYYANPGNEQFDYMTKESPYVPVDGEMFVWDAGVVGLNAAQRMRLQHYTSFSAYHSYYYSIANWRGEYLSKNDMQKLKMPFSNSYFADFSGDEVARTAYDYIRDHLGYRFELQWAVYSRTLTTNDTLSIKTGLINRGFAASVNPRTVYFVLIDSNDTIYEIQTDADPGKWQPFEQGPTGVLVGEDYLPLLHTVSVEFSLANNNIPAGEYKLGLWLPDESSSTVRDNPQYAIRLANRDIDWRNGVNILGEIYISIPGDFEPDSDVDFLDFDFFAKNWLLLNSNNKADINNDNKVNWVDFAIFASHWLEDTEI